MRLVAARSAPHHAHPPRGQLPRAGGKHGRLQLRQLRLHILQLRLLRRGGARGGEGVGGRGEALGTRLAQQLRLHAILGSQLRWKGLAARAPCARGAPLAKGVTVGLRAPGMAAAPPGPSTGGSVCCWPSARAQSPRAAPRAAAPRRAPSPPPPPPPLRGAASQRGAEGGRQARGSAWKVSTCPCPAPAVPPRRPPVPASVPVPVPTQLGVGVLQQEFAGIPASAVQAEILQGWARQRAWVSSSQCARWPGGPLWPGAAGLGV